MRVLLVAVAEQLLLGAPEQRLSDAFTRMYSPSGLNSAMPTGEWSKAASK